MILHELLDKSAYVPPKPKPKKNPASAKKPDTLVDTGTALNRVRRQLRRDAMKTKPQQRCGIFTKIIHYYWHCSKIQLFQ